MPLFKRKRRRRETNARARLMEIAADVYEDGDDKNTLKAKMIAEIEGSGEPRPFLKLLLQLLVQLLPLLLKGLAGG